MHLASNLEYLHQKCRLHVGACFSCCRDSLDASLDFGFPLCPCRAESNVSTSSCSWWHFANWPAVVFEIEVFKNAPGMWRSYGSCDPEPRQRPRRVSHRTISGTLAHEWREMKERDWRTTLRISFWDLWRHRWIGQIENSNRNQSWINS